MQRVSGGYTIVEIMIVLSVTGLLFLAATLLFQGQQGKNEFSDASRDLQSRILDWANDVTTGFYPSQKASGSGTGYRCAFSSGGFSTLLKLQYAPPNTITTGSNEGCIYIGKVIQFKPATSMVYSYTIVGRRDVSSGSSTRIVNSLEEAEPVVAKNTDPTGDAGIDLTESYNVRWGGLIQPISASPTSTSPTYTVAIYKSFDSEAIGTTASNSIKLYAFPNLDFSANDIEKCASGVNPGGVAPGLNDCAITSSNLIARQLNNWRICLKSAGSNQFATINLSPSGDSLGSQINYVDSC